jgi:hypothetical protein
MARIMTPTEMSKEAEAALIAASAAAILRLPDPRKQGESHGVVLCMTPADRLVKELIASKPELYSVPEERIVKQPCGKSAPKGIDFVPELGEAYQAWRNY